MKSWVFTNEECQYGYRSSYFKNEHNDPHIVTYIIIRLDKRPSFSINYGNLKEELAKCPEVTLEAIRRGRDRDPSGEAARSGQAGKCRQFLYESGYSCCTV